MSSKVLLFTVLLCVASQTLATQRCNLYNFAIKGFYQCLTQWYCNGKDLGQVVNFKYKISKIVEDTMTRYGVQLERVNRELQKQLGTNSVDPLAKLIETILTAEPYVTYAVSDLILGMGVTAADLRKVHITEDLADRKNLIKLFTNYMDFSCTNNGIRPLVGCINRWTSANCSAEDNASIITKFLENIRDAYCSGNTADSTLISRLTRELGTVFKTLPEFFGVYKDPKSPYLFNIAADSWVRNQTIVRRLANLIGQDCGFIQTILSRDLAKLVTNRASTIGAGNLVQYLLNFDDAASRCFFRVIKKEFPNFFYKNKRALEHFKILTDRYGGSEVSYAKTNVATTQRYSVSAFGDHHLIPYKSLKPMTCTAIGHHTYLTNEFFRLEAVTSPRGRQMASITRVALTFYGRSPTVYYVSGPYALRTRLYVAGIYSDTVKIESKGNSVRITDKKSGAIFGIGKYRNSYYMTLRMGKNVYKGSLGLFITGCPNPMTTSQAFAGRNSKCDAACAPVGTFLRNSCQSDCVRANDKNMAESSLRIQSLTTEFLKADAKVLRSLKNTA